MKAIVFAPTGLSFTVEAENPEEFKEKIFEATREIRNALDY